MKDSDALYIYILVMEKVVVIFTTETGFIHIA